MTLQFCSCFLNFHVAIDLSFHVQIAGLRLQYVKVSSSSVQIVINNHLFGH